MKLKDISVEQAIEITKLVYGQDDWIKSDFTVKYFEYEKSDIYKQIYEDTPEMLQIFFKGYSFGEKIDKYRLIIYGNLNLSFDIIREPLELISIGISNQYNVFKKFNDWNLKQSIKQ